VRLVSTVKIKWEHQGQIVFPNHFLVFPLAQAPLANGSLPGWTIRNRQNSTLPSIINATTKSAANSLWGGLLDMKADTEIDPDNASSQFSIVSTDA